MDRAELNKANSLSYLDPAAVLREFRAHEAEHANLNVSPAIKHLRTNKLKSLREMREAALFCYGLSCRFGQEVKFSPVEASDYDFIATWVSDTYRHICPIQLKELVPEKLNPTSSVQELVNNLVKYTSSPDLTVVVHINRNTIFKPSELAIPNLNIAALWFFSSLSQDQSNWRLIGNFTEVPEISDFAYPT